MSAEAWVTLGVLIVATLSLARELLAPDVILVGALAVLLVLGILDLEAAFRGFANPTLVAIGGLYVVAAGLRETGALEVAAGWLLGTGRGVRRVLLRLSVAVGASSAFLNNTPIVAMGVPAVRAWARRRGVAASKLLMPLSFASILGGLCTLIGTSTNLVSDGLLRNHGMPGLGFFELARLGLPCAVIGVSYLVLFGPRLLRTLPDVRELEEEEERDRIVEMEVDEKSPLAGDTVGAAGLVLPAGVHLVGINRAGRRRGPLRDEEVLEAGDHLLLEAVEEAPATLAAVPGLGTPDSLRTLPASDVELHEAVVKEGSPLIGERLVDAEIPERFHAAVTGVRRGDERLQQPLEEIVLRAGDVLMLDTGRGFRHAFADSPDLFVASRTGTVGETEVEAIPGRPLRRWLAAGVLAGVVLLTASGTFHIAEAALLGAVAMVTFGFLTPGEARESIDWSVLIVIGAALGLASALETSGAAGVLGESIVGATATLGYRGVIAGAVLATMVLTGLITNNAAAALIFPVALGVSESAGVPTRPLLIAVTLTASLALWTPLGYQTNLMVYGPGNYRFSDFVRVGLPLQLLLGAVIVALTPLLWS